jgi:chemotaxis protein CheX
MQFIEPEICNYTESVWDSILSLKVTRSEDNFCPIGKEDTLAGCVHIVGAWEGAIALQCPKPLARKAAAIMFSVKEENTTMEMIQDAIGELTNMIGGNIKSLLPSPCYLSLPTVAVTDYNLHIPNTELITKVTFECQGLNFAVAVLKKNASVSA